LIGCVTDYAAGVNVLELRQPRQPLRRVPVAAAEELHRRGQEHGAYGRGVDEDRAGEVAAVANIAKVMTTTAAALVMTPAVLLMPWATGPRCAGRVDRLADPPQDEHALAPAALESSP
jgi:hypothetical protein